MDDREFLDAFTEHLDRLNDLARGLTRTAQDLVSETCVLALRSWRRQQPDDPAAWFATICLNRARSAHRRSVVRPVEVAAEEWLHAQPDADTARSALAAVEATRCGRRCRGCPPPSWRRSR